MGFVEKCIEDSMPIWQECLNSKFLVELESGKLDEECFKGYIVDDSIYLMYYAKVFALGILNSRDFDSLRNFYSFLAFVNEGEGSTRLKYLERYGLNDNVVEKLPQREENREYTDYMLEHAQEGIPETMMAALPCTLSYAWIFRELLKRSPGVKDTVYWPLVRDYTALDYDSICNKWISFGNKVCRDLPQERLTHCMEIFRQCSKLELGFWHMSEKPRNDI